MIVDRLTKSAYFLSIRVGFTLERLAKLYMKEIVRLHEISVTIVSDRDTRFVSQFWKSLHKALETKLNFSTAFHPQTDGQSERTIQILEDMLRTYILDMKSSWDEHLPLIEFTYNTVIKPALVWHLMKHYMGEDVDHRFTGMMLVSGEYWAPNLFNKQSRRFN